MDSAPLRRAGGALVSGLDIVDRFGEVGGSTFMSVAWLLWVLIPAGGYLLTISHDGRGVFLTRTWERVARDRELAYPENGCGVGIGPIDGVRVAVTEKDSDTDELKLTSPDEAVLLEYESGVITVLQEKT